MSTREALASTYGSIGALDAVMDRPESAASTIATPELYRDRRARPTQRRRSGQDPDRERVLRWQAGDLSAFEELVRIHEKRVLNLLVRMMGDRDEAEDATQETFLALHRHGHRFRGDSRFSTFVYRVAANTALNRRRALARIRTRKERLDQRQSAGDELPWSPPDPERATLGSELEQHVRTAIESLPPLLRLPVVLCDIEGLPYERIAKVLDVAEGTVKSRIHRARKALRERLRECLGDTLEEDDAC